VKRRRDLTRLHDSVRGDLDSLMKEMMKTWSEQWAPSIRTIWANQGVWALGVAVVLMVVATVHRLRNEFWRLLLDTGREGAIDLIFHHKVVDLWFHGEQVYGKVGTAYPPASFVFLWPFFGWMEVTAARWFWAITTVAALACLIPLIVRASKASTALERAFIALIPLSMYATAATIGNGQFTVHVLAILLAGLAVLERNRPTWSADLIAASFMVFALIKPTVAAPFFWIVVFVPRRWRPGVLVVFGYVLVSIFAMSFQTGNFIEQQQAWANAGRIGTAYGAIRGGYANLSTWLTRAGLQTWNMPASLIMLAWLGGWIYRYRQRDLWILIGVAALVARLWIYHRLYDDLLILLPMITLFRLAKQGPAIDGSDVMAGVLLAITLAGSLAPAHFLVSPPPWNGLFEAGQTVIWIAVLIFLVSRARWEGPTEAGG